jgi:hypothetical protein
MRAKGVTKLVVASLAGDVEIEEAAEYLFAHAETLEKVWMSIPAADDFPQLLQRPGCGRMLCDVECTSRREAVLNQHET